MEENKNSAISVRNVCIDYKSLKTGSIKQNFFKLKKVEQEVFHAVRNVSFEVPEGQILGITGKNGSGKSTMLRAIAGIFSADSGEIDLHGHTISLLSIGVGFKNFPEERISFYLVCSLDSQESLLLRRCRRLLNLPESVISLICR